MASKELQSITKVLRAQPWPDQIDIVAMRSSNRRPNYPLPDELRVETVDAGGVPAERLKLPESGSTLLLHFHGGGYCLGSAEGHRQLGARLARAAAARVLLPNYRLAPENPFPAAVDDAITVYRWVLAQGVEPASLVVGGDSAGGGLALAMLLAVRDAGDPLPAAVVLYSPWVDLAHTGGSLTSRAERDPLLPAHALYQMADAYLAGADPRSPAASPLFGDLRGLPPMLVQVGTEEVLHDDAERLAERARAAGVDVTFEPWEGLFHVFQGHAPVLPEGQEAIERTGEFIRKRLAGNAAAAATGA